MVFTLVTWLLLRLIVMVRVGGNDASFENALVLATEDAEMSHMLSGAKRGRDDFEEAIDAANADFDMIGLQEDIDVEDEGALTVPGHFVRNVRAYRALEDDRIRYDHQPSRNNALSRVLDRSYTGDRTGTRFVPGRGYYFGGQGGTLTALADTPAVPVSSNGGIGQNMPEVPTPAQPAAPPSSVDRTGAVEGAAKIKRTWYKGRVIEYSSEAEKQAAMDRIDGVPQADPGFVGWGFYGNVLR